MTVNVLSFFLNFIAVFHSVILESENASIARLGKL